MVMWQQVCDATETKVGWRIVTEVARGGGTTDLGAVSLAYDTLKEIQEKEDN